jgi:hypothetical protein
MVPARLASAIVIGLAFAKSTGLLLAGGFLAVAVAVLAIVVGAAVWSRNKDRRDAALAVLDRLFRCRR